MVVFGNKQLFSNHLTGGRPLGLPLSQGEQIWCLYSSFISFRRGNIISIYLGRIELRLHGPMHNFGSPRVQVEHLKIADTPLFLVLLLYQSTVFHKQA